MIAASRRGANAYRRIESESRSPLELVVMLYDGALKFLGEARDAGVRGDIRARGHAISRVLAIISELQNTLDVEKGGAVAEQLDNLYTFATARLIDVTLKKDLTAIDDVQKLLIPLRDAWVQAAAQPAGTTQTAVTR